MKNEVEQFRSTGVMGVIGMLFAFCMVPVIILCRLYSYVMMYIGPFALMVTLILWMFLPIGEAVGVIFLLTAIAFGINYSIGLSAEP